MDHGKSKYVTELRPTDVLFGRGSGPNDHEGNVRFRLLVAERKAAYMDTNHRMTKTKIARDIVDRIIAQNGRFLRKLETAQVEQLGFPEAMECYEIVADDTIMEKAKQALRQNAAKVRGEGGPEKAQKPPAGLPSPQRATANPARSSSLNFDDLEPLPLPHPVGSAPPYRDQIVGHHQDQWSGPAPIPSQQASQLRVTSVNLAYPQSVNQGNHQAHHRHTASVPVTGHELSNYSMAELPNEEVNFESRRQSMTVNDLMKAQMREASAANRYYASSNKQGMDDLMDSFSQMKTEESHKRMMASTETMGTIEHLGSVADMSLGTMGSSTFSLFRGGDSQAAMLGDERSESNHTSPATSSHHSSAMSNSRSSRSTNGSAQDFSASLSINDVMAADPRRKSSSISITGMIDAVRRQVDAEYSPMFPRSVGIMEEQPDDLVGMGQSSMDVLKAALGESSECDLQHDYQKPRGFGATDKVHKDEV